MRMAQKFLKNYHLDKMPHIQQRVKPFFRCKDITEFQKVLLILYKPEELCCKPCNYVNNTS